MAGKMNGYQNKLTRELLREVYEREVVKCLRPQRQKKSNSFRVHYVLPFLSSTHHTEKFCKEVHHVLNKSVLTHDAHWNVDRASEAFLVMQRYALNLLEYPWKKEFKDLKLYSGFYAANVQGHLVDTNSLFDLMGYVSKGDQQLLLRKQPSRATLVMVACDCFAASVECHIMQGITVRLDRTVSIGDVYKSRIGCVGDEEKCAQWTKRNCGLRRKSQSLDDERRERDLHQLERRKEEGGYSYRYEDQSQGIGSTRGSSISSSENQIHILRSKEDNPDPRSFVSQDATLHRSCEISVFEEDASRGSHYSGKLLDVFKDNRSCRDSGYGSKPNSKEITIGMQPAVSSPVVCDGDEMITDNKVDQQYSSSMNDLRIAHPPRNVGSGQPSPGADYPFVEATVDDHIQKSLQYLKKKDIDDPDWKRSDVPEDEWAVVRETLRGEVGSERGNILGKSPNSSPSTDSLSYRSKPLMCRNLDDSPKAWTPSTGEEDEDGEDDGANTILRKPRQRLVSRTPTPPQTTRTGSPYENVEEAALKIIRSNSPPLDGEDSTGVSIRKQPSFKGYTFGKGKKSHNVPIKVDIPHPPDVNTGSPNKPSYHTDGQTVRMPPPVKEKSAAVKRISAARKITTERKTVYDNVHMDPVPESPPPLDKPLVVNLPERPMDESMSPPPYSALPSAKLEITSSPSKHNHDWQFVNVSKMANTESHYDKPKRQVRKAEVETDAAKDFGHGIDPGDTWAREDSVDGPKRNSVWQCDSCTYANDDYSSVCHMCSKSRRKGAEDIPLTSGGPHCPACTYVNEPGAPQCSMCEQELKGCPTYI